MENISIEEYIKDLSPELQVKARACTSTGELLKLARENRVVLPDDLLESVAGGKSYNFKSDDRFHVYREDMGGRRNGKILYLYTVKLSYLAWYKFYIVNGQFEAVAGGDYMGIGSKEMLKLGKDSRAEQPEGYYILRKEIYKGI